MEFPYKAQDLGGITFGFMELDFPYPPQDLGGITFGFMEESQSATPTIYEEEIKVERVPVEIDWNPWVSPRPSKCSRKEESQRATMVKQGIIEPLDESFHEPEDSANRETMKKHECAICGFGTDRLHNFKRHLKIHADVPDEMPKSQVVCTHCGKQFMTMSGLTRHTRKTHTHNAKYKCDFCQKQFNEKAHFQGHVQSHAEVKSCKCASCDMDFQYKPNLRRHEQFCGKPKKVRKHHRCDTCGAVFSRKDILKDHKSCAHEKTKTYDCTQCGAKYFWRSSLSKHINVKHPDLDNGE